MPTLYYHPLSSYCWKALIAIKVLEADVALQAVNLGSASERDHFMTLSPFGKIPALVDQERPILETSIIIEYLQQHHARGGARLIPDDPSLALDVRMWDRLMDQYVMTPMQALTSNLMTPEERRDANAVEKARKLLLTTYGVIEKRLEGRTWLAADGFSLADCAAAPALFYAIAYVPFEQEHAHAAAYFERLMAHPAIAAVIDDARPFFKYFPGRAGLSRRFYEPET